MGPRTIPDRTVLIFITQELDELQFTVNELPTFTENSAHWNNMLVGTLSYDIQPDRFNTKPGKEAYRAVYLDFTGFTPHKLVRAPKQDESSGVEEKNPAKRG